MAPNIAASAFWASAGRCHVQHENDEMEEIELNELVFELSPIQ